MEAVLGRKINDNIIEVANGRVCFALELPRKIDPPFSGEMNYRRIKLILKIVTSVFFYNTCTSSECNSTKSCTDGDQTINYMFS